MSMSNEATPEVEPEAPAPELPPPSYTVEAVLAGPHVIQGAPMDSHERAQALASSASSLPNVHEVRLYEHRLAARLLEVYRKGARS